MPGRSTKTDAAVRGEASDWVALIHDPEAAVDRAAFERWRYADPRHTIAYARAERAWDSAALLGRTSFGRVRSLPERRRLFDRPQVRYAFAAAAVLVVALLGLSVGGVRLLGTDRASQATELASSVGQIRKVAMVDGSVVTLDTDSVLRVAFNASERHLYLSRGRARFAVAHDAARPFIVTAGGGSVIARGTVFDVDIVDSRVKVVLLRGAIEVRGGRPGSYLANAKVAHLHPGQQISFRAAAPLATPQPAVKIDIQWTGGMLAFDRTRLADAIIDANRYSRAKIHLADPALNDLRLTGAFRSGDTVGLAKSMAGSFGLRVERTSGGDVVLSDERSQTAR